MIRLSCALAKMMTGGANASSERMAVKTVGNKIGADAQVKAKFGRSWAKAEIHGTIVRWVPGGGGRQGRGG